MPWFLAKKEVFQWLQSGQKTIDLRKGGPKPGDVAVFQCGPKVLRLKVLKMESGLFSEVLRSDNFRLVVPSALVFGDAVDYLRSIYGDLSGVFTAYYVESMADCEKG